MRLIITLFLFSIGIQSFTSQSNPSSTIRGFVVDKETGEPAPFAKIFIVELAVGAVSDLNGFFSIPKIPVGIYTVEATSVQYGKQSQLVEVDGQKGFVEIRFEMESDKILNEVVISAEEQQRTTQVQTSITRMDQAQVERIPTIGGESDVLAAFSITPGVVTTGDQGGQLYVRGGTPIQNRTLLDGMTIYSPFHSIGFFSVFETELIKNVDIYTGGFSARYGGRISSVVDITYRDGNKSKFSGKASVSPFMARLILEGPMAKLKDPKSSLTYVVSGKQSLLKQTAKPLYPYMNDRDGLPFNFTDIYAKMTASLGGRSKISVFGFGMHDGANFNDIANLNWRSYGGGMNFSVLPSNSPLFIKGHVNASNYQLSLKENNLAPRFSSINGFEMGFDFSYATANSGEVAFGINVEAFSTNFQTFNEIGRVIKDENFSTEINPYFNYRYVSTRWVLEAGMRLQYYASYSQASPEPRAGIKYNASEKFRLKASGGRYSQNFTSANSDRDVVNLFNGLLSAPTNVQSDFVKQNGQVVSGINNGLQFAWHAVGGFEIDITKQITLNVEGYYKYFDRLSNINLNKLYDDLAQFSLIDDVFKKDFIIENGEAYGLDILVKQQTERTYLWLGYSLGKVTRWDGFMNYATVFDRRHNVNLVFTYLFGAKKNIEISARWNYGSGLPFTPTAGFYASENFQNGVSTDILASNPSYVETILGALNSKRLPDYHRLDLSAKFPIALKDKEPLEIAIGITNVYNRQNIFYVNRLTGQIIYQLPILPSIGLSYRW
jgi:opacity protein-like surface antigen